MEKVETQRVFEDAENDEGKRKEEDDTEKEGEKGRVGDVRQGR